MARDLTRLIEAALILATPMQRDGDNTIGFLEKLSSTLTHSLRNWPRE
jgi:hypothetical protein